MQRRFLLLFAYVLFCAAQWVSQSVFADERTDSGLDHFIAADALSALPLETSITGQVKFEPRYTRIPEQFCASLPCSGSKMYWSLVIYSGNTRYVLDRKINMGLDRAPDSVEIQGVKLAAGSNVRVLGKVVPGSNDVYFLLDLEDVSLLDDHR